MLYFLLTNLWVKIRDNMVPVMGLPTLKQVVVLELGNLNSVAVFVESVQDTRYMIEEIARADSLATCAPIYRLCSHLLLEAVVR